MSTLKNLYTRLKDQKQFPVLFLMLVGITAVLFAFGSYLKSYFIIDIDDRRNLILLLVLGFAMSAGFFVSGLLLSGNKKYADFSSGIISLSILLNYVLLYFLSLFDIGTTTHLYSILSGVLILGNTSLSILLTIRWQDRLIALLSVSGGFLSPFFFDPLSDGEPLFFVFLWLLALASIYIAYALHWNFIAWVSFVCTSALLEYFVLDAGNKNFFHPSYIIVFHAFAYLFIYFSLLRRNIKSETEGRAFFKIYPIRTLEAENVIIVLGSVFLLLFNLFFYFGPGSRYGELGAVYAINLLPFIAGFIYYNQLKIREIQLLMQGIMAFILVLIITIFAPVEIIGIFLAMASLLFIYMGFAFGFFGIRKYSYLFLLAGVAMMARTFGEVYTQWENLVYSNGYFNLLGFGVFLIFFVLILATYKSKQSSREEQIHSLANELLSLWVAITSLITISYFTSAWLTVIAIVPTFFLFYRALTESLIFTRLIAYGIYIYLLLHSVYWMLREIPITWQTDDFFASYGFWNYFVFGGMLTGFVFWKRYLIGVKKEKGDIEINVFEQKNGLMRLLKASVILWFAGLFLLVFGHWSPIILIYLGIIPVAFTIVSGYSERLSFVRYCGFLGMFVIIYAALSAAFPVLREYWDYSIMHEGTYNLLWPIVTVAATKGTIVAVDKQLHIHIEPQRYLFVNSLLSELITVLSLVAALTISFFYAPHWTYNLCIIPMFGLIYLGHHNKLTITELSGFALYFLMAFGIYDGFDFSRGLLHQDVQVIVLGTQVYGTLWLAKYFYQKFVPGNRKTDAIFMLHDVFYFLLPLFTVFLAYKKIGSYMPYVLWGVAYLSFVLTEVSRNRFLLSQFFVWVVAACIYSFARMQYVEMLAGSVVLWLILVYKHGVRYRIAINHFLPNAEGRLALRYTYLELLVYYFSIAAAFVAYLSLTDSLVGALFVAVLLLCMLLWLRYRLFAARISYRMAYRLAYLLALWAVILLVNSADVLHVYYLRHDLYAWEYLFIPLSLFGISIFLYGKRSIFSFKAPSIEWYLHIIGIHFLYMGGYLYLLAQLPESVYSYAVTVAWVVHAIHLMFKGRKSSYRFLSRLAYLIFIAAIYKFVVLDMPNMPKPQLIAMLIVLGIASIASAFFILRSKKA